MSKFCQNCGTPLSDEMQFCQNCGASCAAAPAPQQPVYEAPQQPVYEAPQQPTYQAPQQPVYQQPAYQVPQQPVHQAPKAPSELGKKLSGLLARLKTDRKFMLTCLGIAAAVLVVIVVIIALASGGSKPYTKPIDNLIAITVDGKVSRIKNMAPAAYWDWYEEYYGQSIEDLIDEYEDSWEDELEDLEDEYGKNIRMSYDVLHVEDIDEDELEDIAEALEHSYEIKEKDVKDAKEVTLLMTIEGNGEDGWDANLMTCTMVKIKNAWYYISYYSGRVAFITGN